MELIRRDTDYAIRLLLALAENDGDEAVPVTRLSRESDVSRDFVHKIMQKLARANIVEGRVGKRGGYLLKSDPATLDLLTVVTAVQGPPAVNRCLVSKKSCKRSGRCPVRTRMEALQKTVVESLEGTTLKEILEQDR